MAWQRVCVWGGELHVAVRAFGFQLNLITILSFVHISLLVLLQIKKKKKIIIMS